MAGTKGNATPIDRESMQSAVHAIREQLVLGLEALAELERVRDQLDLLAARGTVSRDVIDDVGVRFVSTDDLHNDVRGFTQALAWVRTLELTTEEVAQ